MYLPRPCTRCGQSYRPNHKASRFCSRNCYAKAREHATPSKAAARKRAQKAIPLGPCSNCGSTKNVQRQHRDHSKPLDVVLLCQKCHAAEDMRLGKWGIRAALSNAYRQGFTEALLFVFATASRDCDSPVTEWSLLRLPSLGGSSRIVSETSAETSDPVDSVDSGADSSTIETVK